MPLEPLAAEAPTADSEDFSASPAPPASPPSFAPGWALACVALLGATSSPTGCTLPAAWKPQSKSRAVSL